MSIEKAKMESDGFPAVCFFFLLIHLASSSALPETNSSYILQDVLKAISASQKWKLQDVRISKFDVGNVRKPKSDLASLIHQLAPLAVLHTINIEGPLELHVHAPHQLSLSLPMNISYTGLKHVIVGEGITLDVRRAQEISFFDSSDLDLPWNASTMFSNSKWKSDVWQSTCMTLIPIHVSGSASLSAYGAHNPALYIETTFISEDTILLLLPEKSSDAAPTCKKRSCPFDALSLRLRMVEKILRSILGRRVLQDQLFVYLEANTKASIALKFPIEVERHARVRVLSITRDHIIKWTTRSITERVGFEVVARVESERLKLVSIRKFKPVQLSDLDILKPNKSFSNKLPSLLYMNDQALRLPVLRNNGFVHL
ncbi:putative signal peptidase I [Senna tora]|uniref:Putative signal peptidase I n=1 Tax=Senna tora TaxID=362788 RepID=A0A834WQF2_9FABA|nr:putative signal peptidase I [Senna tora]